uniref:Uncharacterized protein n=1 Tax=Ixodes ricinus TaxID=34613 RepID=A0A6B0UHP4_IXORI
MRLFANSSAACGFLVSVPPFASCVPKTKRVLEYKKKLGLGSLVVHYVHTAGLLFDTWICPVTASFIVLSRILNRLHITGVRGSGWLANHAFISA